MAVRRRKTRKRTTKKPAKRAQNAPPRKTRSAKTASRKLAAQSDVARLKRDLRVARDRQAASAEILRAIAASPGDAQRSLQLIAETTEHLFAASAVTIRIAGPGDEWSHITNVGEGAKRIVATVSAAQLKISGHNMPGVVYRENRIIHLPDIEQVDPEFADWPGLKPARAAGTRTLVGIPLRREDKAIGAMIVHRQRVAAFADHELALLQSFADQAVIAIENARLFNETREALAQQTATADALKVISRSTFDLDSVLSTLVESAAKLCEAEKGVIFLREGDAYRMAYNYGFSAGFEAFARANPLPTAGESTTARAAASGKPLQAVDIRPDDARMDDTARGYRRFGGYRTNLGVPLRMKGEIIGVFTLTRDEPRAFTERQIELVGTFADQAAIAIENTRLMTEQREALERQTATAEILGLINSSSGDLQPVFDAILTKAHALCGVEFGSLQLYDGESMHAVATHGFVSGFADILRQGYLAAEAPHVRPLLQGERFFQIDDSAVSDFPTMRSAAELEGIRTVLFIPLRKESRLIGMIAAGRREVRAFAEKEIGLLENFAAQAALAVENARLFNETAEALEQQTATADVLKVISRSAFDLRTVLDTLVETAAQLCNAGPAQIFRRDGDVYRYAASRILEPAYREHEEKVQIRAGRGTVVGRMALERRPVQIRDAWEDPDYEDKEAARIGNVRSMLAVPLLRGGEPVGAFALARNHVEPFTDSQIKLVSTFADQAVIAIENVRLFNETREALERQTATADILKVIASSPSDLQPVFDAIAERSNRLIGGHSTAVFRFVGDNVELAAFTPVSPLADEMLRAAFPQPVATYPMFQLARDREIVEITDTESENSEAAEVRDLARARGFRSLLLTTLLGDSGPIGLISVTRKERGTFAPHHVELLRTFADQAVIAIQNVKLFDEVQAKTRDLEESLLFQTASADVLKVISRSPDSLQPVLDVIVDTSRRLCSSTSSVIFLIRDGKLQVAAHALSELGTVSQSVEYMRANPVALDQRGSAMARAARERRTIHIADTANDPEFSQGGPLGVGERRALLSVPLMSDGEVIGGITLRQSQSTPFTPRQIELIQTFADQAVIAISNVNLFEQVQARTRELTKSLEDLRTAQDRLVQTEKLASLGQLTAGIAHEIKNPLNFVNNFAALSSELIDELLGVLEPAQLPGSAKQEVDELTHMLKDNLDKVVQHGKRADSIVKNMLLHSRSGSGEHRPTEINAIVEESLNLAYHGARAERQGFNITLQRDLDPDAGLVDVYPQEMTRVLLNLISNGFYAASKRKAEVGDGFEPTLSASTRNLGDRIEIRVRDNGTGIPLEVKEKMFNPFFTTKPAGEGTGLGLSMSHDIVVKQHQGRIEVETEPGAFTEFIITLPRAAAALAG